MLYNSLYRRQCLHRCINSFTLVTVFARHLVTVFTRHSPSLRHRRVYCLPTAVRSTRVAGHQAFCGSDLRPTSALIAETTYRSCDWMTLSDSRESRINLLHLDGVFRFNLMKSQSRHWVNLLAPNVALGMK